VGGLVSYIAAAAFLMLTFLRPGQLADILSVRGSTGGWFLLSTFAVFLAQFFRYLALGYAPVVLVEPLTRLSGLFTLLFSFFMNRRVESFAPRVIAGIVMAVGGSMLMAIPW
jgi:drug/metabolite transporter (DMT)-like permease